MNSTARVRWFWAVLFPPSCVWAAATWLRRKKAVGSKGYKSNLKTICVGNIHSGGSGKTPLVKAIADYFKGNNAVVLSRGYRAKLSGIGARVDLAAMQGAQLYGDEPWMLAGQINAPVFIDRDRSRGLRRIEEQVTEGLVILDDGFQNFSVRKDISLVCINTDKKPSDNFCLPLGDLREPISALAHCDAIILTSGGAENGKSIWENWLKNHFPKVPIFAAQSMFDGFFAGNSKVHLEQNTSLVSFCGIADPNRFVAAAQKFTTQLQHLKSFKDHHSYSAQDVDFIISKASKLDNPVFVTTDKDWAKVAPVFRARGKMLVSLRLSYKMSKDFWVWLEEKLDVRGK